MEDVDKVKELLNILKDDNKFQESTLNYLIRLLDLRKNPFHPLAFINGEPEIGKNVHIGFFSEVNAKGSSVIISDGCDIASFVSINVANSYEMALELSEKIERKPIKLENNVFVGSHSFIGGGVTIGHHSVVGAGTILVGEKVIPPYSLVVGNPAKVKEGYYKDRFEK